MKHYFKSACILSSALCFSLFHVSVQAGTPEMYTIDPTHTAVLWHANHFNFSHPSGKWMANGKIELDKEKMENSKVSVTIQVGDIVTGLKELDKHLKSKLFFDVKKFPVATFISNKVEVNNNKITKVYGNLSLHGVSKPVILDVTPNNMGVNPVSNKETVGFTASTKLLRSDFGVSAYLPGVGDEIEIDIQLEAYKENRK